MIALAISLTVVVHAAGAQNSLLYTDGDSVLTALASKSIALGQPQNWAMSPVLFIPEIAVYAAISGLGLGVHASITINAIVNFVALYGAIRLVAGRSKDGSLPTLSAVASFSIFAALALLEGQPDRQGFQLASLLATTTYYSATLLGTILTVGVLRRIVESGSRWRRLSIALLASTSLLSTLNNPLYVGWAVLPVSVALGALAVTRRLDKSRALALAAPVIGGAIVGYLARGFFSTTIVADGRNYLKPDQAGASLDFYATELLRTPSSVSGIVWLAIIAATLAGCAGSLWVAWDRSLTTQSLIFLFALSSPMITTIAAIATGTEADRYLQPWIFVPVACLAAIQASSLAKANVRSAVRRVAATIIAATLLGGVITAPRFMARATQADSDLACVVSWVELSGRTGAGQFWSVRGPMAYLDDPSRLAQVDEAFNRYDWLINRAARPSGDPTFLIQTDRDLPYVYPEGPPPDHQTIDCGRYQIVDFGQTEIPLGPPHN